MSAPTGTGTITIGRATATVAYPTSWTQYAGNPIITGPSGHSVRLDSIQLVGGTWYLYATDVTANDILLYTSTDGFTFSEYGAVLTPTGQGCTDGTVVSQGSVINEPSDLTAPWKMYYDYRTAGTTLQGIRYAVSSDGKTWSKTAGSSCANLVSTGTSYDSTYIEWQQILKIGSYYELVYGSYSGSTWSTNIAYSTDPASGWQKSLANPIFSPSGGSNWDGTHVSTGAFYEIGGEWWLFYQGTDTGGFYGFGNWSMGMASLPNGNDPSAAIP